MPRRRAVDRGVVPSNMRYSGGYWHWRIIIPKELRDHFGGRRELTRSTRTGDQLGAQAKALLWTIEARDDFERLRQARGET